MHNKVPWDQNPVIRKTLIFGSLALLILLPPILLVLPIWDIAPVDDSHIVRPARTELPPEENTFERIINLAGRLNKLDASTRFEWDKNPEAHRESIDAWIEQHSGFPGELRDILASGQFQTPWVADFIGDRFWVTGLMELYRHLHNLTRYETVNRTALDWLELQFDLLDHLTALKPESLIDALIHLAGAGFAAGGARELFYRFAEEMSEAELQELHATLSRLERLNGAFWMQALEHEYIMMRDLLLGPGEIWRQEIPAWMPWWNSFFFQPHLTLRFHLQTLELNRATLNGLPPPPPWASVEEIQILLDDLGLWGLREYQNYLGKRVFYPVDLSRNVNRAMVHIPILRLQTALLLYKREHGAFPPDLASLIPAFLDEIPLDPYDGKPIRYDPVRQILWSVNENGIDHGGSREGSPIPHRQQDLVFDILRPAEK